MDLWLGKHGAGSFIVWLWYDLMIEWLGVTTWYWIGVVYYASPSITTQKINMSPEKENSLPTSIFQGIG